MTVVNIICEIILPILLLIFLLFSSGFFAGSETAFTSISKIQVRQLQKKTDKKSKRILKLRNKMDFLITTVLTGTNLINTLMSALVTSFVVSKFGSTYVTAATAILTILVIVFSEIIPKTLGAFNSLKFAEFSSGLLLVVQTVFFPVVWIFSMLTKFIEFIEKILFKEKQTLVTEEELKTLIDVSENEGTIEVSEKKLLNRIFEFSDLRVSDFYRHRSLVTYLNVNSPVKDAIKIFSDCGYSRIPIYEENLENVVGLLFYKSIVFAERSELNSPLFIRSNMKKIMFVPETLSAVDLLKEFKKAKQNFAVVVDEYGTNCGIVTMDDILKAVFGHVTDENGLVDDAPEKKIKVLANGDLIVPGNMKLEEINEVMQISLESENYDTLAGYLLEKFDELPSTGRSYKWNGILFVVEDQSDRRIQSVRMSGECIHAIGSILKTLAS